VKARFGDRGMLSDGLKPVYHNSNGFFFNNWPTLFLNLHYFTKLIHVFLIRQNPGAGIVEIQIYLPGLSIPVLLHFQNCFDRLEWLISGAEIWTFKKWADLDLHREDSKKLGNRPKVSLLVQSFLENLFSPPQKPLNTFTPSPVSIESGMFLLGSLHQRVLSRRVNTE